MVIDRCFSLFNKSTNVLVVLKMNNQVNITIYELISPRISMNKIFLIVNDDGNRK